jgi:secondary thiamine-phosphate synthase enzyme
VWVQREITLEPRPRGFHLVTREVLDALPELRELRVGLAHLLLQHTSASLTLNENASPDVRRDFESWFDDAVPEDAPFWTHTLEGPDDMPAHIKASLLGPSLSLPIRDGRLALGTWQGIYLCEHRDRGRRADALRHAQRRVGHPIISRAGPPGTNIGRQSASDAMPTRRSAGTGLGQRLGERVAELGRLVDRARRDAEPARHELPVERAAQRARRSPAAPRTGPAAGAPSRATRCRAARP